jgi:protein TonB
VHVSSGVMLAALISRVEPVYPPIAKIMHLEGRVDLRAIIRMDGSIGRLIVVDGNPILAVATEAAVRQWRYKPTLLNDQPVEVDTIVRLNFRLQ